MLEMSRKALCLAATLAIVLAPCSRLQAAETDRRGGPGLVENPLVDQMVDEPLRKAENVFDVYRVIVDWLDLAYPEEGEAHKSIRAFSALVKKYEDSDDAAAKPDEKGRVRTIEMPMSIDQLLGVLRAEAPGIKGDFPAKVKGNPKAQVITSVLLPFLHMRGITYRVRPLIERSFWLHTAAINALRANRHELALNAPKNAMAIFEFLTYPMAQKGRSSIQFNTFSEVQDWVESQLIPTYDVAIPMAERALANMGDAKFESVTLTNFLLAPNPFPDTSVEQGNLTYGAAEVRSLVASLYATRAALRGLCAYNLDDYGKATDEITSYLFGRYLKEKVPFGKKPRVGSPSNVRYEAFEKFGSLFTLRNGSHGPAILQDLRKAWDHYETSMQQYFAARPDEDRLVRLRWVQASRKEFLTKVAPQVRAVLAGPASITDYIGGETVDIDLPGFLSNLPQDLKGFYPASFDASTPYRAFEFSSGKLIYANYDFGNPTGWKQGAAQDTWGKLFPRIGDAQGPGGEWIAPAHVYRAVSRTYVGGILGPLLGNAIN